MGQHWQSFKAWLGTGNWFATGRALGRWTLPAFFYTVGTALALRTMVNYTEIGFRYSSTTYQINEWLIYLATGESVDLGFVLERSASFMLSLPLMFIYSLVFLAIAYKLTPRD